VLYGDDGIAEGAIRTDDRDVVKQWTDLANSLYADGQEMSTYFQWKVRGKIPPNVG
jgi:hypothetical protein